MTAAATRAVHRRSFRRALALLGVVPLAVAVLGAMLAAPADAHTTEDPYLYLFVSETTLDGRVELSIADLEAALGLSLGSDDREIKTGLQRSSSEIQAYAADHLNVGDSDSGAPWLVDFSDIELFRERSDLAFAVIPFTAAVPDGVVPVDLDVRFDPFFDDVGGRDGLLLITGGWVGGSYDRQAESLVTFTAGRSEQTVRLGDRTQWQNFSSGVTLGIDHIRSGPDHIMFVLALLLPSVLIFAGDWKPMPSFGRALWRVLKIASFFTLAHSITFTLAGMGWLPLPPAKLVETIIALSIAAAALHNLRPIFPNREWALSFVFGLFHGMGFASLVAGLDVSRASQLISLLGRNVGIEIGQVAVILIAFPALFLYRRTSWYRPILTIGSTVLAALSLSWMVERVFELDLGTDALVEGLVQLPRGYVLAALATAVAIGVRGQQARRGRLQPIGQP